MPRSNDLYRLTVPALLVVAVAFGACHLFLSWFTSDMAPQPEIVDVNVPASSVNFWATEPKYVFWNIEALRSPKPIVIVLGASNAREGFDPDELQPLLPDFEVHSLAISNSEVSQVKDLVELAFRHLSPEEAKRTVFLFGMSLANYRRPPYCCNPHGLSDLELEMVRYHVYRRSGSDVVPMFTEDFTPTWKNFIRPYATLAAWADHRFKKWKAERAAQEAASKPKAATTLATSPPLPPTPEELRRVGIKDYQGRLGTHDGTFPDERLPPLIEIAEIIQDHGAKLLMVQLPHVRSNRLAMPEYQDFLKKVTPYSKKLAAMEGVEVLDLFDQDRDEDFRDANHPYPETAKRWCKTVAPLIQAMK